MFKIKTKTHRPVLMADGDRTTRSVQVERVCQGLVETRAVLEAGVCLAKAPNTADGGARGDQPGGGREGELVNPEEGGWF